MDRIKEHAFPRHEYSPVLSDLEEDSDIRYADKVSVPFLRPRYENWRRRNPASWKYWFLISIVLTITHILTFFAGAKTWNYNQWKIRNFDHYDYLPTQVRDTFFRSGFGESFTNFMVTEFTRDEMVESDLYPWRMEPGPESDAYFAKVGGGGKIFLITAEDMRRLGKDPAKYAHIGEDWGYGDRIYPAQFDMHHQFHCLHSVRKLLYTEYYHANLSDWHDFAHWDHCLWAIYDFVRCHATLDIYNYKWVEGMPRPFPDHTSKRQCRNVDEIMDFVDANDVSDDARVYYLVPQEGDFIHTPSPDHKALSDIAIGHANAELPAGRIWADDRREKFHEAMEKYRLTGEIPRV